MSISTLTSEELNVVKSGLNRTLNTIIYDLVEGNERKGIKRSEVIEVVLDADYLEAYGGRENKAIFEKFRKLSYKDQIAFAKTVFTYKTYGL